MPANDPLTVRELVNESGLGLSLLTGDVGIDRPISAIHISDIPDPAPWLVPGSVLLTTGAVFAHEAGPGLRLLDRLAEIDTAALGVGPGVHVESVPDAMVRHAIDLRLPVFTTPVDLPFRVIVGYVHDSLASNDLYRLRRTVTVQNRLLDLLVTDNEVTRLVESVAQLLDLPVMLFDGDGSVLAAAGARDVPTLAGELWAAYESWTPGFGPPGVMEAGQARYYFRDVVELGRVQRVVAAAAAAPAATEYVDTSLSFLQRLVALDLLRSRNELEVSRRRRVRLLEDLLAGTEPAAQLEGRLAAQGLDVSRCRRIVVCRVVPPHGRGTAWPAAGEGHEPNERVVEAVDAVLGRRRVPSLSTARSDAVVALVALPVSDASIAIDLLRELEAAVAAAGEPAIPALGCSAPIEAVDAMPRALQEAREACAAAERGAGSVRHVLFESMRGRFRLLEGQSPTALADLVRRTVTPLAEWDARHKTQLVTTLRTFVEQSFSPHDTAAALFVHRNTLQRRLARIEELLGVDFARADDVLELYLGVCAAQLLGDPAVAGRQGD